MVANRRGRSSAKESATNEFTAAGTTRDRIVRRISGSMCFAIVFAIYAGMFGPGVEAAFLSTCNVTPGDPDAGYTIEKLSPDPRIGDRMPLSTGIHLPYLTAGELDLIRTWILEGAQDN